MSATVDAVRHPLDSLGIVLLVRVVGQEMQWHAEVTTSYGPNVMRLSDQQAASLIELEKLRSAVVAPKKAN